MDFISLNSRENKSFPINNGLLSTLDNQSKNNMQIVQGMSPKEIADIISDHLIDMVKKQFQVAKEKYQQDTAAAQADHKSVV